MSTGSAGQTRACFHGLDDELVEFFEEKKNIGWRTSVDEHVELLWIQPVNRHDCLSVFQPLGGRAIRHSILFSIALS